MTANLYFRLYFLKGGSVATLDKPETVSLALPFLFYFSFPFLGIGFHITQYGLQQTM